MSTSRPKMCLSHEIRKSFFCCAGQMFDMSADHLTVVFIDRFQSETGAEETEAEEEHVELFTTPQTKMGAATSDFGYNLFRALASRETATNVFLAPISVSAVLTQLSLGDDTNALQTKSTLVLQFKTAVLCTGRQTNWMKFISFFFHALNFLLFSFTVDQFRHQVYYFFL